VIARAISEKSIETARRWKRKELETLRVCVVRIWVWCCRISSFPSPSRASDSLASKLNRVEQSNEGRKRRGRGSEKADTVGGGVSTNHDSGVGRRGERGAGSIVNFVKNKAGRKGSCRLAYRLSSDLFDLATPRMICSRLRTSARRRNFGVGV
jgi:hypothetical protein